MNISDVKKEEKKGLLSKVLTAVAACTTLFAIFYVSRLYQYFDLTIDRQVYLSIFLMVALVFVFIMFRVNGKKSTKVPWYDYLFIIGSIVSMSYIFLNYEEVFAQGMIGYASPLQSALFVVATVAVLEATRRTAGLALTIIAILFLIHVFFNNYMPGILHGRGYDLDRVAFALYVTPLGLFSLPLDVIATIVFTFMVFSDFVLRSGAGDTFIRLPMAIVGSMRGGAAKVAVLGSTLFGMLSGSAIANVAAVGTFTIPLMKNAGYDKNFAGGVEAVSSTGGQIVPPVLGGAMFMMANWLSLPYVYLCFVSVFPALLYYVNVYMVVDFEAARKALKGLPKESLPPIKETLKKGWMHFVPLILLVYLLVIRIDPEIAVLISVLAMFVVSAVRKETRMGFRKLRDTLASSFRSSLMVTMACAAAGIIFGALGVTGIGVTLSGPFLRLAGGNTLILMILTAIAGFIMGMGMPGAAIYVILGVMLVPTLVLAGVAPIAAHFFVVLSSLLSLITPPVALAVFTAVGISGGSVMKTGWQATRLGIVLFILPFWFVYRPGILLMGTPFEIASSVLISIFAIIALAAGVMGYGLLRLNWYERVFLIVASLLLIIPSFWGNIIGVVGALAMLVEQIVVRRYRGRVVQEVIT